ncbi:sensor histidine kinase [Streptomyces nigra]|uniref:sensor histidine kinase n=1 Tax=Streptomyces nigra TaxID=1827580 RepID=UPI00381E1B8D
MTATDTGLPLPRTARWREAAVVAAAGVLCLLGGTIQVDDTLTAPPAAAYLVALASCAVLPVRRRTPLAALAGTTAVGVLVQPLGLLLTPPIVAPALIAAYAWVLAAPTERRAAGAVSLAGAALLLATAPLTGDLSWKDAGRMGVVGASPLVAGVVAQAVRHRRAYLAAVEERAARAEESREAEARRRVAEERVRIARELHDLVAHQITLANAQAQVAAQFFDTRPDQSRTSLRDVVATTGQALDELRATVGLLRQTGDTAEPVEPAPGLARLPELLDTFRRAGLEVAVREEGTARPLPPGVDLTAYRIVQEALTNVAKHARTGRARIALTWHRDRVTVTVADDGPGGGGAPERPPGYGLIGMRERATAVGGDLSAGRRPEGGFLVTARLPVPRGSGDDGGAA